MAAMTLGRRWVVGAGVLAALLAVGGLVAALRSAPDRPSSGSQVESSDGAAPLPSSTIAQASGGAKAATPGPATQDGNPGPVTLGGLATPQAPGRVVKHATLTVTVKKDRDAAVGSVLATVQGTGGFVVASNEDRGRGVYTLRIPSAAFETTLAAIRRLGDVQDESLRGDDVTAQYVDLEARLRNWRAQEAVLLDLMARARSIPDTITVQQQLSQIQQQIEEIEGQRRVLDDQTSFGTITLTLAAPGAAAATADSSSLASAWTDAVGVTLAVLGGTLVVLGALLPIALIAALIFGGWVAVRRRRLRPEHGASVA